jgi:hypothetical protein
MPDVKALQAFRDLSAFHLIKVITHIYVNQCIKNIKLLVLRSRLWFGQDGWGWMAWFEVVWAL